MNDRRRLLNGTATIIEGTRTFQGPYRLVHSRISTSILEGLLASILVCMVLAFFTVETRNVVRVNPCSIAGMASLLVDSQLFGNGNISDGAEWWSDKESLGRGVFVGCVFSLCWWDVGGSNKEKRFRVDIFRADRGP